MNPRLRIFGIGITTAILAFSKSLPVAPVLADDWPQWRGPDRNGVSAEKGWSADWSAEGPKRLWKGKIGVGYSSVAVSNGRLYTMGNIDETDHVFCLDANTGKELWKHSYPCSSRDPNDYHGTRCTPAVEGSRVFSVSREGHFFCLDANSGKPLWSKNYRTDYGASPPKWGFSASPLVEGDLVIVEVGTKGASVVAFNKATGEEVWKAGSGRPGYSSPVAFTHEGKRAVAVLTASALAGRSLADGKELWRFPWKTSYDVNAATPVIEGDKAFVSGGYNHGCALVQFSASPPKVLWENKNMRNHVNSCVLWQGHLYGFDESELRCLDLQTGDVKWTDRSHGKGSLIVADGKLIIYSDRGKLSTAEASSAGYKELASAQVLGGRSTWAVPVLANGKIYCRSLENLVCLEVKQ